MPRNVQAPRHGGTGNDLGHAQRVNVARALVYQRHAVRLQAAGVQTGVWPRVRLQGATDVESAAVHVRQGTAVQPRRRAGLVAVGHEEDAAADQAIENLRVVQNRYKAGSSANIEVLDAETLRQQALSNRDDARYELVLAKLRLARAVGALR